MCYIYFWPLPRTINLNTPGQTTCTMYPWLAYSIAIWQDTVIDIANIDHNFQWLAGTGYLICGQKRMFPSNNSSRHITNRTCLFTQFIFKFCYFAESVNRSCQTTWNLVLNHIYLLHYYKRQFCFKQIYFEFLEFVTKSIEERFIHMLKHEWECIKFPWLDLEIKNTKMYDKW